MKERCAVEDDVGVRQRILELLTDDAGDRDTRQHLEIVDVYHRTLYSIAHV